MWELAKGIARAGSRIRLAGQMLHAARIVSAVAVNVAEIAGPIARSVSGEDTSHSGFCCLDRVYATVIAESRDKCPSPSYAPAISSQTQ